MTPFVELRFGAESTKPPGRPGNKGCGAAVEPGMSSYETLVGLEVTDEAGYQRYREGMTPILGSYGGRFRWDFRVEEVLKGERDEPLNRVFVLSFPDVESKEAFFRDPDYLAVRKEFFDRSVGAVARIAEYEPVVAAVDA